MAFYRIDAKPMRNSPCFGIETKDGVVIRVAPIATWAIGKPLGDVLLWYINHGAAFIRLRDLNDD